jgi:hypothetical protein
MGDVLTGRLARPAVQEFFSRFARELDNHFDSESHPDEQTKWLDYYLEKESELHRTGTTNIEGITEKDVRLMMAIYLWEVYYLIREKSTAKPVMAAYDFVMSDAFQSWNQTNPVDLNEGIFTTVASSVYARLPPLDDRVRQFDQALLMISARAAPSTPAPLEEYDAGSDFESNYEDAPSYIDNTTGPEGVPDKPLGKYRGVPAFIDADSDDDDSESAKGASGGVGSSNESPYANDVVASIMAIVREKNPKLHNSFYFVFRLYALLKVFPAYQTIALSRALETFMESQNMELPFDGSLPTETLVTDAIVSGISKNIQSVGQDDRTPEGLILRELVEYCINIKELLEDGTANRKLSYSDIVEIDFVDFFANEEFLTFVAAEKKNILTSETEEDMLEAIRQSSAPVWKKYLLAGALTAASLFAVRNMVYGAMEAYAEGTANAARVSTVPGQYYTDTGEFDQEPGFMGVDFGVSPVPASQTQVPYGYRGSRFNFGSNLDIPSRRRRRRRQPTFSDHTLTI